MFEIIQMLRRANTPMTAHAIANILEVNKRTIYRDIVTLQAMRVPIEGEAGIGYIMRAGFDLPPLMFTADEIEAIVVGLSLLGRTGDAGLQAAAFQVTQKIADVLPKSSDRRIDESPLHVSKWNNIPPSAVEYRVIRQAIRDERKIFIIYKDAEAQVTERTVLPIALVYYVDNVMLAAWCEMRNDFRHFRVDRIDLCQPLDRLFKGESERLRVEWRAIHELFSAS